MGNLLIATAEIEGIRPLLWHAFTPEAIPASGKRERTGVAGNDPTEWQRTVLITADRQLYLPPSAVFGCLREAARFTRKGRGSIQTAVAATLQVRDEQVLVDRFLPEGQLPTEPTALVYLYVTSVRNPATKGRNIRYRVAAAAGWRITFSILWDRTVVSRGEMEAVLIDSGRLVGIGNGRQIGFGRFEIQSFRVIEN